MVVRRLQRGDIALARLAGVDETLPPPGEPGLAEAHEQEVRRQARMPAVAVGETMNPDELVMKPCGDLVDGIGLMSDPAPQVVQQLAQLGGDAPGLDADIALGPSELSRPFSDVSEHALVQRRR